MTVLRSVLLFALAAVAEIGGAWLVWQGVREHRGLAFVGAGILALGLYGFVATFQSDPISAASWPPTAGCSWPAPWPGAWPSTASHPTATTWWGPALCLAGGAVIMYAPGPASTGRPTPNWEQAWRLSLDPPSRWCDGGRPFVKRVP